MGTFIYIGTMDKDICPYYYDTATRKWEQATEPYTGKTWLSNQTGFCVYASGYFHMRPADWAPFLAGLEEVQIKLCDEIVTKYGTRSLSKVGPQRWQSLQAPRPLVDEHPVFFPVQLERGNKLMGLDADSKGRGGWYALGPDTTPNPNKHFGPWGYTVRLADDIQTSAIPPATIMRIVTATYDQICIYRDADEVQKWALMWAIPRIKDYWRKRKSEK